MKRVGLILKPDGTVPADLVRELTGFVQQLGHNVVVIAEDGPHGSDIGAGAAADMGADVVSEANLGGAIDVAVALGGDGTMLRASDLVADASVPVLGINLGRLGFLSPYQPDRAQPALRDALEGRLPIEHRMRLRVTYQRPDGETIVRHALNDAVVHQGTMARLIELEARFDGTLITEYRADGLIVCTPTGSTAYNLAAGGPVLTPGQEAMAITPICPHALTNRPLVVPPQHTIALRVIGTTPTAVLTVDGHWGHDLDPDDLILMTRAAKPFRVFGSPKPYFDILRQKLHWGVRADRGENHS